MLASGSPVIEIFGGPKPEEKFWNKYLGHFRLFIGMNKPEGLEEALFSLKMLLEVLREKYLSEVIFARKFELIKGILASS